MSDEALNRRVHICQAYRPISLLRDLDDRPLYHAVVENFGESDEPCWSAARATGPAQSLVRC